MSAKPSVLASRRLGYALDALSKNTLIDLLIDRATEDISVYTDSDPVNPSDEELIATIQSWLDPVAKARGDRPANLAARLAQYDTAFKTYDDRVKARNMVVDALNERDHQEDLS